MGTKLEQITLIKSMISRAGRLVRELEEIYQRDLGAQGVSAEARNLTHEVLEKCSNILDQSMSVLFEHEIRPNIAQPPKRLGYFPCAQSEHSYRTTLGQWGAPDLNELAPSVDAKLRTLQPFASQRNQIFARIRELANKKHTSLAPQRRVEEKRVNVSSQGASISWNPSAVRFGSGVSVTGARIDPRTQMPVPTQGVNVKEVTWVSFHFEDGNGENALSFCKDAISAVEHAVDVLLK